LPWAGAAETHGHAGLYSDAADDIRVDAHCAIQLVRPFRVVASTRNAAVTLKVSVAGREAAGVGATV
jgi:hypothetical protein